MLPSRPPTAGGGTVEPSVAAAPSASSSSSSSSAAPPPHPITVPTAATRMPMSPPTPAPSPRPHPVHMQHQHQAPHDYLESNDHDLIDLTGGNGSDALASSSSSDPCIDPQTLTRLATQLLPTLPSSARITLLSDLLMHLTSRELAQISSYIASRLRIDFLSSLPIEVSLHVLSFIDDPLTLARCSQVSRFWRSLVNDEHTWEAMCVKYRYRYRRPSVVYPRMAEAAAAASSASATSASSSKRSRGGTVQNRATEASLLASLYRRYRERGLDPSNARDELRALHDLFLLKQQQQQQQQQGDTSSGSAGPSREELSARFYEQLEQVVRAESLAAEGSGSGSASANDASTHKARRPSTSSDPTAAIASSSSSTSHSPNPANAAAGWLSAGPTSPRSRLPILTGVGANPGFDRYTAAATGGGMASWASGLGLPWGLGGLGDYIPHLPSGLGRAGIGGAGGSVDGGNATGTGTMNDVSAATASTSSLATAAPLRRSSSGDVRPHTSSAAELGMGRPDFLPPGAVPRFATYSHSPALDIDDSASSPSSAANPFSYKAHFKRNYLTESNWHRGGRLLTHHVSTESGSVCTCMAMDERWLVVGMANGKIHLFDARTGEFERTLQGRHDSGVWCLALVSRTKGKKGKGKGKEKERGKARKTREGGTASSDSANATGTGDASYVTAHSSHSSPQPGASPSRPPRHDGDGDGDVDMLGNDEDGYDSDSSTTSSSSSSSDYEGFSMGLGGSSTGLGTLCSATPGFGNETALLISGGCDRELKVWDLSTGQVKFSLRGHHSTVRCLRVLEGRPIAVSGGRDSTVRVWDISEGKSLRVLAGHQNSVRCLEVAGNLVATGSYDCTCRVWNVDTGECLHVLRGHYNQIYCIGFDGLRVATGSLDSTVRVWDARSGEPVALLQGHTMLVGQLQMANNILISGGSDGRIIAYSLGGGEKGGGAGGVRGARSRAGSVAASRAAAANSGAAGGSLPAARYPTRLPPSAASATAPIASSAAATGNGNAYTTTSTTSTPGPPPTSGAATSVQALYAICAHDNSVSCIQFDEHFILTGGNDGTVRLWNLHDGSFVRELVGPQAMAPHAAAAVAPAAGGAAAGGGARGNGNGGEWTATTILPGGNNATAPPQAQHLPSSSAPGPAPATLRMENVWKLAFRDDRVVWVAKRDDEAGVMGVMDFRPPKVPGAIAGSGRSRRRGEGKGKGRERADQDGDEDMLA